MFTGCASHVPYDVLDRHLSGNDCQAAIDLMAAHESDYGENDALLFHLDSAMVQMECRDFNGAQKHFRAAEDLAEQLYTLSLSREAISFVTNEYVLAYPGDDFERAMIHLMSALTFLDEGQPREALVECRRLDSLLTLFNDKYDSKNVYREDAFARYLSGILREADNDVSGAFIDYKKAVETYQDYEKNYGTGMPRDLGPDLFRAARKTGRVMDAMEVLTGYGDFFHEKTPPGSGQVVWIQLAGKMPPKKEDRVMVPTTHGPLTIAFPKFAPQDPPGIAPVFCLRSQTGQTIEKKGALVSDLSAIARAAAKQAVIHQIAKNDNKETQKTVENVFKYFKYPG
ncbi:MAG: hypothetical protein HUN05_02060 [Desulfobacter sp.]|nr:MAG: hypothetical protein HUN05_02060 [Desulfobacter sp.]